MYLEIRFTLTNGQKGKLSYDDFEMAEADYLFTIQEHPDHYKKVVLYDVVGQKVIDSWKNTK